MSALSPRSLPSTFLSSVNALLAALNLPWTIDNPTDLTPSLLLAVFESLISARLPITQTVRQSRTRDAQSRAMLVLLGVLECDVLRGGTEADHSTGPASTVDDSVLGGAGGVSVDGWVDEIGLGEVDPEKLADGGWDETIFVGELLCWLARRKCVLPRIKSSSRSSQPRSLYSNHHSYGDDEGETADFSSSLLLRPSPASASRAIPQHRVPSPSLDVDDEEPHADFSAFSYIADIPRHPLVHSPEPSLSVSATSATDFSIRARSVSSRTSVSNLHEHVDEYDLSHDTIQSYSGRQLIEDAEEDDDLPPTFRPHCIHELDDPSYIRALAGPSNFDPSASRADDVVALESEFEEDEEDDQENDPYAPPTPTPQRIRLTGWIDRVDTQTELSQYAASRSQSRSLSLNRVSKPSPQAQSTSQLQLQSLKSKRGDMEILSHSNQKSNSSSKSMLRTNTLSPLNPSSAPRSRHRLPSPSPPPPQPSTSSSKHLKSTQRQLIRSPSPPSDPDPEPDPDISEDEGASFEVSFSTLVNTSTPAKPRPPRRSPLPNPTVPTQPRSLTRATQRDNGMGSRTDAIPSVGRRRSPSYTPSPPPSFSGSGHSRGGLDVGGGARGRRMESTRADGQCNSGPVPVLSKSTASSSSSKRLTNTNPSHTSAPTGTSRNASASASARVPPSGSTSRTSALLNERARLLTELAALKRARAASGRGGAAAAAATEVLSHGVGVGVR